MKKVMKIGVSCLGAVLILWSAIFVVNFARYKNNQPPILASISVFYDYEDGYAHVYKSLGYTYIEYNRNSITTAELVPFWEKVNMQ